jgi:hypothetical protein
MPSIGAMTGLLVQTVFCKTIKTKQRGAKVHFGHDGGAESHGTVVFYYTKSGVNACAERAL